MTFRALSLLALGRKFADPSIDAAELPPAKLATAWPTRGPRQLPTRAPRRVR